MTIDTRAVTKWWKPEDGDKADIADVVMRIINESAAHTKPLNNKVTAKLINDLELEPTEQ